MNSNIFKHFKDEESFVKQILDHIRFVENKGIPYLTKFLTPREQLLYQAVVGQQLNLYFDGGYMNAERCRALITTEENRDMQIVILQIDYASKYNQISHRDVLGALLHLGIKREVIGDILVDDYVYVFVDEKIADYLTNELKQIGRAKVKVSKIDTLPMIKDKEVMTSEIIVSSLRLDTMIAAVYHLPRAKASALIEASLVKVNHRIELNQAVHCQLDDLISVRRFGRFQLEAIKGQTKKQRYVIIISQSKE